jgi:hypothetical protein
MKRVLFAASLVGFAGWAGPSIAQGTSAATAARGGDVAASMHRGTPDRRVIFGSRPSERRRTFIDANGLECDERVRVRQNGEREYDLKCREPKHRGRYGRGNGGYGGPDDRDTCIDRNRDRRCDDAWDIGRVYPTTLPDMIAAIVHSQGRRTDDVTRWLGTGAYTVRTVDRDRNRRPELASWFDAAGVLLQQWADSNGDGRADVVRIYRGGELARVIGR